MAVVVENAKQAPVLLFNRVFMESLSIDQRMAEIDTDQPYYVLKITIRMYAVDQNGKRHYEQNVDNIILDDFQSLAIAKAVNEGDMDLANAGEAIKLALIKILIDQRPDLGLVQEVV